jgi:hypothetical protein
VDSRREVEGSGRDDIVSLGVQGSQHRQCWRPESVSGCENGPCLGLTHFDSRESIVLKVFEKLLGLHVMELELNGMSRHAAAELVEVLLHVVEELPVDVVLCWAER